MPAGQEGQGARWTVLGASRGEGGILGEGIRQALLRDPTYAGALACGEATAAVNADIRVSDDPARRGGRPPGRRPAGHVRSPGGSTPRAAYERAAGARQDWSGVDFWFTDERCVPPDHEQSNFRMADRALLARAEGPDRAPHAAASSGRDDGAADYERE